MRDETAEWYENYYRQKGRDRNDPLYNREVAFQVFASDAALIGALQRTPVPAESATVLDVGCGNGQGLLTLIRLGFDPRKLHGIEVQESRVLDAARQVPRCHLVCGDGSDMPYPANTFDVVFESGMFIQLVGDAISNGIAAEMLRVCKPGGIIVLSDWRFAKFRDRSYVAVDRARIRRLFGVGTSTTIVSSHRGALLPPIGRWLSKHARPLYFLVHATLPFLSAQIVTVLRKER